MRTTAACIAISVILGGGPGLAQSSQVQSITDTETPAPVENLGFERQKPDADKGLTSGWAPEGNAPDKKVSVQLTASEANKANYLTFTGGSGYRIVRITPGPNDKIVSVTIIYNGQFVDLPGASISKGDKPGTLKTGLTSDYLAKLDAGPYQLQQDHP